MRYLTSRLLQALLMIWLSTVGVFTLVHLMPGGVLAAFANNPTLTPETRQAIIHALGLDKPLVTQYLTWLFALLHGNLGTSFNNGQPVLTLIGAHFPPTLELMGAGYAMSLVFSLTVGVLSAIRRYSWIDYVLTFFAYAGIAMPVFWLAVMLILVFSVHWHLFPVQGFNSLINPSVGSNVHHLVLPAITLATFFVARWSRYIRSSTLEVMSQDYVRTARAKGLGRLRVLLGHILRNALIPFVTVFGLDIGAVVGGAVITETIFAWPGMGRLFFDALTYRDFPVVLGVLVISATVVILANLVADLAYGLLDPRIELG
jgi:peptide/nickel transport system permease protein